METIFISIGYLAVIIPIIMFVINWLYKRYNISKL